MKILKKTLCVIFTLTSFARGYAQDNSFDDFIYIDAESSVIAEVGKRATPGVDWQFELHNKAQEPVFVLVRQQGVDLVPDLIPKSKALQKSGFLVLQRGQSVRLAGLETLEPLTLIVVTKEEIPDILDNPNDTQKQKLNRDIRRKTIVAVARYQGRIRTDLVPHKNKTIFLNYEQKRVAPVKKTLFKRYTDSGLSLDRNLVDDPA